MAIASTTALSYADPTALAAAIQVIVASKTAATIYIAGPVCIDGNWHAIVCVE